MRNRDLILSPSLCPADVECHSGVYMRSLVRDIATALGTVAVVDSLIRTQCGDFGIQHALKVSWSSLAF